MTKQGNRDSTNDNEQRTLEKLEQRALEKLADDLGGEQILKQLVAEHEKDGAAAIDELIDKKPGDFLAAIVFLAARDPRWKRRVQETLLEYVREFGLPKLPH
jgi:hypothetical protein